MAARFSGAVATVTRPAPTRRQASPASLTAPGMPAPPPTISTRPKSPLFACRRRDGSAWAISPSPSRSSSAVNRASAGGFTSRSSNSNRPAYSGPSPRNSPVFSATKLMVQSARTAVPITAPLSAFSPEGRSSANTGRAQALMAWIASDMGARTVLVRPVPSSASTITSAGASSDAE